MALRGVKDGVRRKRNRTKGGGKADVIKACRTHAAGDCSAAGGERDP